MNIPADPGLSFVALIVFLIGLFLFFAGLDILKIEKITVRKGFQTWFMGIVLMVSSAFVGLSISLEDDVVERQVPIRKASSEPAQTTSDSGATGAVAQPLVKYTNLEMGDLLYTRGCTSANRFFWVNRFKVATIDEKGIAWGTSGQAVIRSADFASLKFQSANRAINLSEICVSGGCYTKESEASSDVKRWLRNGCPW